MRRIIFISFLVLGLNSCQKAETQNISFTPAADKTFADQWYQGKAELTRYELEQARYGELHKGDAVLIFVTEDFRTDKQVKLENYTEESRSKSLPILKMNFSVRFNTGIYPYSVMTSVFSPVDTKQYPHALKISNSVQEWCGHVYTQLNLRDGQYQYEGHSYFEKEADQSYVVGDAYAEDEIWTKIRLNPASLPIGAVKIIPGLIQARFLHRPTAIEKATASITEKTDGTDALMTYTLKYESYQRELSITFRKAFPHEIMSFEGVYVDGFGEKAKLLKTRATRAQSMKLDYWTKNSVADSTYRLELGLK